MFTRQPGASSQGGGVWRQMPPFLGWGDFFLTKGGMCKSKITRGKRHSGSNRNRAGKLLQLPPLEFTGLHRLPPLEIGPENSFNYPPSNSRDFIDYPPRNRAGKLPTPSNFGIDGSSSPATFKVWLRPRGECFHDPGGIDAPVDNIILRWATVANRCLDNSDLPMTSYIYSISLCYSCKAQYGV